MGYLNSVLYQRLTLKTLKTSGFIGPNNIRSETAFAWLVKPNSFFQIDSKEKSGQLKK